MTLLIILSSILLILAIFTGAFFLAKYVATIQLKNESLISNYKQIDDKEKITIRMRNELLETNYKLAEEHIAKQEEALAQLQNHIEQLSYEAKINDERTQVPRTWNPADMLNSGERS